MKKPSAYEFSSFTTYEEGVRAVLVKKGTNRMFLCEWRLAESESESKQLMSNQAIFEIEPVYSQDFRIAPSSLEGHTFFTFCIEHIYH